MVSGLALAALVAGGCGGGGPMASYKRERHDPHKVTKALVLPFLDARTFRGKNDELNGQIESRGQEIFAASLRSCSDCKKMEVMAPHLDRPKHSITDSEAIEAGASAGADVVVEGQVFSFTDTRAASTPPSAGFFVRIFSVPERKLVFVCDHYSSGSGLTREQHAQDVADAIVKRYMGLPTVDDTQAMVVPETPVDAPKMLVLPFYELKSDINIIEEHGGGPVVTAICGMELARLQAVNAVFPPLGSVSHKKPISAQEALRLAREAGADYVMRGEVVEFRRAANVPNPYLAIISVAVLAGQIILAEQCGSDFAVEVYRVSDGKCVFARRLVKHTKYIIQIESIIRELARDGMLALKTALDSGMAATADPLIDSIVPPQGRQRRAENETTTVDHSRPAESRTSRAADSKTSTSSDAFREVNQGRAAPLETKDAAKAEDKTETKETKKSEAKPEEKAKPESKDAQKTERKSKPENTDAPKPEAKSEEKAQGEAKPEEKKGEAKTEGQDKMKPEAKTTEAKPESQDAPKPESKPEEKAKDEAKEETNTEEEKATGAEDKAEEAAPAAAEEKPAAPEKPAAETTAETATEKTAAEAEPAATDGGK